jgi:lysozyme family protein
MWEPNNFGKINSQAVADITFDWYVNSGSNAANTKGVETYGVDEILNRDFGFKLPLDSKFDAATINAINKVDSTKLYNTIKKERVNFYNQLVKNNPSQQIFQKGWLARINSFPDIIVAGVSGLIVLFVVSIFVYLVIK